MTKAKKISSASRASRVKTPVVVTVSEIASTVAMTLLIGALVLAGYNLSLTVGKSGELAGLESSWQTLETNYTAAFDNHRPEPPAQDMPSVLWSVVRFREGEMDELSLRLVGPLVAHSMESGTNLEALLIERKNAGSRDVLVREFRKDGTEETYMWPSTHVDNEGFWTAAE